MSACVVCVRLAISLYQGDERDVKVETLKRGPYVRSDNRAGIATLLKLTGRVDSSEARTKAGHRPAAATVRG